MMESLNDNKRFDPAAIELASEFHERFMSIFDRHFQTDDSISSFQADASSDMDSIPVADEIS